MYKVVTCTAPVNIAVIKYWGKLSEEWILPLNDSISFTLSQEEMCATTTVMLSPHFESDRLWLNQQEVNVGHHRIINCVERVKSLVTDAVALQEEAGTEKALPPHFKWHFHICSENNFPTAAGLASSAAGFACMAFGLAQVLGYKGDLSKAARLGSGSACRSVLGGIVHWNKVDKEEEEENSLATQIAPPDHFPNLHIIICVANIGHKKTSSTEGMQRSVKTSSLLQHRVNNSVLKRIQEMLTAIKDKDWSSFCDLTMADSNEMHAVCLDTFPPCVYMNDTSHAVARFVHEYNALKTKENKPSYKICYTFDAGPNACLFVPGDVVGEVASLLHSCFPQTRSAKEAYWRGIPRERTATLSEGYEKLVEECNLPNHSMNYFIQTRMGGGPTVLPDKESIHLLDLSTGLPKAFDVSQES